MHEYGADILYETAPYVAARWVACDDRKLIREFEKKNMANLAHDAEGQMIYLAPSIWRLESCMEQWPGVSFSKSWERR